MGVANAGALVLSALVAAGSAGAQTGDVLPPSLSGRWTVSLPSGVFIDAFSIAFEGGRAPGKVNGMLTFRGLNCGAKDEPIAAGWDGKVLKFEAVMRANVNAQRAHGRCPAEPYAFVLVRNADGRTFEGQVPAGNAIVTLTASP